MKQYRLSELKAQHCTGYMVALSNLSGQYKAYPNHSRFVSNLSRWKREGMPILNQEAVTQARKRIVDGRHYQVVSIFDHPGTKTVPDKLRKLIDLELDKELQGG